MNTSELFDRCRDESFWNRLSIQETYAPDPFNPESNEQTAKELIRERDVCLRKASECGQFLLHLLDVSQAEKEALGSQCESLANAGISQELELSETRMEVSQLLKKTKTLSTQLQSAETRISQLQSALEKSGMKTPTNQTHNNSDFPPSTSTSENNVETMKLVREFKKQSKIHTSEKRDLESQILKLKEELVALQCVAAKQQQHQQQQQQQSGTSSNGSLNGGQTDIMVALVRELTSANGKLEGECKEVKGLLEKSQQEVVRLMAQVEDLELGMHSAEMAVGNNSGSGHVEGLLETSLAHEIMSGVGGGLQMRGLDSEFDDSFASDMGAIGMSPPKFFGKDGFSGNNSSIDLLKGLEKGLSVSPSSSGSEGKRRPTTGGVHSSTHVLIRSLHSVAMSINSRLLSTDTVSINRRLRRAFDLAELTRLSHSVLTNIEHDIQNMSTRFPTRSPRKSLSQNTEDLLMIVDPMVKLVQMLLGEVASLKRGMNDLSLAYFEIVKKKAEESESVLNSPRVGRSSSSVGMRNSVGAKSGEDEEEGGLVGFQKQLHKVLSNPVLLFGWSPSPLKGGGSGAGVPMPDASRSPSRGGSVVRSPLLRETAALKLTGVSVSSPVGTGLPIESGEAFDPPPDHPYWKTIFQEQIEHGVNEEGDLGDPPPDHPYWKSRTRTVSATLGDLVGSLLSSPNKTKPPRE
ncbi:UNVERIFIED_CONTAM: hypothetical protein HDU68_004401 [Siphonaria sp. JEL0065]|nr:hypothetical protein HDU68_004401 [Siphonaria sp. JEL0065]